MADLKGVSRAVASLRAELHSLALAGATITIEVSQEQWHRLRQLYPVATTDAQAPEVHAIKLVGDQVNGDVVIKPRAGVEGKAFTVDELGLQPVTTERKVEQLAELVRKLLEAGQAVPEVVTRTNGYVAQLGADLATVREQLKLLVPLTPYVGPLVNIGEVGKLFDKHHERMDGIDALLADHLKALEHDERAISELREKVAALTPTVHRDPDLSLRTAQQLDVELPRLRDRVSALEQRDEAAEAQLVELQRKVKAVAP